MPQLGAAGKVRGRYLVSSKLAMVSEVSFPGHATLTGPSAALIGSGLDPSSEGAGCKTGVSLSRALDPPGRLSALVHTATVNSLLSGLLHSAAALFLLPTVRYSRRLMSCSLCVAMVVVTLSHHTHIHTSLQSSLVLSCPSCASPSS